MHIRVCLILTIFGITGCEIQSSCNRCLVAKIAAEEQNLDMWIRGCSLFQCLACPIEAAVINKNDFIAVACVRHYTADRCQKEWQNFDLVIDGNHYGEQHVDVILALMH